MLLNGLSLENRILSLKIANLNSYKEEYSNFSITLKFLT
jgi:hypothetical protein